MKRTYLRPECELLQLKINDNVMFFIESSTGAVIPFGKGHEFEDDDDCGSVDNVWDKDHLQDAFGSKVEDFQRGSWKTL